MGLALIYLIIMLKFNFSTDYLGDGEAGGGLPSADAAKTRLVLDNAVWDAHLAAQSGEEHHQLNRIGYKTNKETLVFIIRGCQGCHPLAK